MNSDESVLSLIPARYPFLVPVVTNIDLQDWSNHFNISEIVNKIPTYSRRWVGKINLTGNLQFAFSADLIKTKKSLNGSET